MNLFKRPSKNISTDISKSGQIVNQQLSLLKELYNSRRRIKAEIRRLIKVGSKIFIIGLILITISILLAIFISVIFIPFCTPIVIRVLSIYQSNQDTIKYCQSELTQNERTITAIKLGLSIT